MRRELIERKGSFVSRSILDYFAQNYADLLNTSVKICARICANPSAGEDVLHNVAVVLCKKQDELADIQNYGAYIAVCIRRAAINYAKRNSHSIPFGLDRMDIEPDPHAGSREYDYFEWVASLEKHLQKFDPIMRKAFIAHYIDDVPSTALAAELGISEKALSLRFSRMRKELKRFAPSMFRHLMVLLSMN